MIVRCVFNRYCSAGSDFCWDDCAVDWIVEGIRAVAVQSGYSQSTRVLRVTQFDAGTPHLLVVWELGSLTENAASCSGDIASEKVWDLDRQKRPTKALQPLTFVADDIVSDMQSACCMSSVLILEPGFHFVTPRLLQVAKRDGTSTQIIFHCDSDPLQHYHLARTWKQFAVTKLTKPPAGVTPVAILLLCLQSCAKFWARWELPLTHWLQAHGLRLESNRGQVAFLGLVVAYSHQLEVDKVRQSATRTRRLHFAAICDMACPVLSCMNIFALVERRHNYLRSNCVRKHSSALRASSWPLQFRSQQTARYADTIRFCA